MPPRSLQSLGSSPVTLAAIFGLLLTGFLWDLTTPLGYVPWLVYLPALLLTLALPYRWDAPALAGLCTILILLGYLDWPSAQTDNMPAALFNRTLGIAILWLVAGGCLLHKRMAREMDQILRRHKLILDTAQDGIYGLDVQGRLTFVNRAGAQMVGWKDTELLGQPMHRLLHHSHPDGSSYPAQDCPIYAAIKTGTLRQSDKEVFWRKDGTSFPVDYASCPTRSADGSIGGAVVIFRDTTEHKRSERELKDSEERYRSAVTALDEGIVLEDADGVILACNQSAERILGLSADQMMGKTSLDPDWGTVHEDGSPFPGETHPIIVTVRTGKPCKNVVMGVRKPDGTLAWISINTQPLYRPQETKPYAAVASFVDITERRRLETALRLTQFAVDHSSEGMFVIAADGRILAANDTVCRRLEYSRDEILAMSIPDIDPLFPRERWPSHWQELKTAGRLVIETIHRTKSGRTFPVEVSIAYLPLANEECCCSIITDITERHRAEQRQMSHRLVLEMLTTGQPLTLVLETLVLNIEAQAPGILGSVLLLDKEGRRLAHGAAPSLPPDYCRAVDGIEIGPEVGSCGTAAYRGTTVIVEDIGTDPLWRGSRELAQRYGLAACWSKPICTSAGRVLGTFAMYYHEPRAPRPEEVALLDAAVQLAGIAIERKQVEEQLTQSHEHLQALTAHLESVREDERARIARELHDDLGQALTGMKMDLASLAKSLTPPFTKLHTSHARAKLDDMQAQLSVAIQGIRRMVLELRPPVLDHLGLDGALEWLAHDFQKCHGILCKFHSVGSFDTIDASAATTLFRIAQEAMTNGVLHAKAASMRVELAHEEQHLRLTVADDGIGLNEADVTKPTSFGLIGIQERVRLLGGTVAFQGRRGRGTRVIVRIPWEAAS
ncbi:MAG: PAS domain S-box protein [Nitrospira sp.]|nr:PAS domain S-box protein [Nitrospira sp.]